MATENEAGLRRVVMAWFQRQGAHVTNHEDSWQGGIADLSFALDGAEGWIELKDATISPVRKTLNIGLESKQIHWLKKRGLAGAGRVWVLARIWPGPEFWLIHWSAVGEFARVGPAEKLRMYANGVYSDPTAAFERILKKEGV